MLLNNTRTTTNFTLESSRFANHRLGNAWLDGNMVYLRHCWIVNISFVACSTMKTQNDSPALSVSTVFISQWHIFQHFVELCFEAQTQLEKTEQNSSHIKR